MKEFEQKDKSNISNINKDKNISIKNDSTISHTESTNNKSPFKLIRIRKRKSTRVRAYCSKCFQCFSNGPHSKICLGHIEKECALIPCQKNNSSDRKCIRKFPNIQSANRHTHCLSNEDIKLWDESLEIQKCLGSKREPENKLVIDNLFHNDCNNNNSVNLFNSNSKFFCNFNEDNSNYFNFNSSNVSGLINEIDQLHFDDKENKSILIQNNEDNINTFNKCESIDEFFEKVQKETNIPNSTKKKLVKAMKMKGIFNVNILKLFYQKYKNWDFLVQNFKGVSSQIEGVAICIEFLLKV